MESVEFTASRVVVSSKKTFAEVIQSLESKVGKANHFIFRKLIDTHQSLEQVKIAVESMVGQSGFMIFAELDGGSLLSLWGKPKRAKLYVIGNPLIANEMFEENTAVGLYIPLRLLVYDDYDGNTYIAYDKPSSILGQFENEKILQVARKLDQMLDNLMAMAVQ